jgi:hypothetical protein
MRGGIGQLMMVKTVVRGEGPNDYGRWDYAGEMLEEEGCYGAFVRTAATNYQPQVELRCVFAGPFPKKLPGGSSNKKSPKLTGFERHAFYSALEAVELGAEWLVVGVDTDRGLMGEKKRLPQANQRNYKQLFSGFKKAEEFRAEVAHLKFIALVPCVKLESWLLADSQGFYDACGFERGALPKHPEELYGTCDAKTHLNTIFEEKHRDPPDTSCKAAIAARSRPLELERVCPLSYPPFLRYVQRSCNC